METIRGGLIDGPWDMASYDGGGVGGLFVTNVLNGTVAADGSTVRGGTVVRIVLDLTTSPPTVLQQRLATRDRPRFRRMDETDKMIAESGELCVLDEKRGASGSPRTTATRRASRSVLAKKGTVEPTRLTYDEALEEAICFGWVDGQLRRRDYSTFLRRFTPRLGRSNWSARNVRLADRLCAEGRMHEAGLLAVERARASGAWERAYEGQAAIEVPADLEAALAADPAAQAAFAALTRRNRYAVLYRIRTANRPETRARRIERYVGMLARGETPHR